MKPVGLTHLFEQLKPLRMLDELQREMSGMTAEEFERKCIEVVVAIEALTPIAREDVVRRLDWLPEIRLILLARLSPA